MTIPELIAALDYPTAALYVDDAGTLRYVGPKLPAAHPIRQAIAQHRADLIELFTYAAGRRCVFSGCHRLVTAGSRVACQTHQREIDREFAGLEAAHTGPAGVAA